MAFSGQTVAQRPHSLSLYPALVDVDGRVDLTLQPPGPAAVALHRGGVRRLLLKALPQQTALIRDRILADRALVLAYHGVAHTAALVDDVLLAAAEQAFDLDSPVRTEAEFAALLKRGRAQLVPEADALRTLFRRPELRLSLAAIDGERVLILNTGARTEHACIFADSVHHRLDEFAGTVYERAVRSVIAFALIYVGTFALGALALLLDASRTDLSVSTFDAIAASATALGNVGPGFGLAGLGDDDRYDAIVSSGPLENLLHRASEPEDRCALSGDKAH